MQGVFIAFYVVVCVLTTWLNTVSIHPTDLLWSFAVSGNLKLLMEESTSAFRNTSQLPSDAASRVLYSAHIKGCATSEKMNQSITFFSPMH